MKSIKWFSITFSIALLILFILEVLTLISLGPIRYFQDMKEMEGISYFLTKSLPYFRIILLAIIIWSAIKIYKRPKRYPKVLVGIALLIYLGIFYVSNFQLKADKLFYDLRVQEYEPASNNVVLLDKEILGVTINGESKAYPLDFLAYHHKVLDSVGNAPILATYCIWCRSGKIFSPVIDGKLEQFSLVGINEYNAIIEDESSATWWRQATGEAIAGEKKGSKLDEIYCEQMALSTWIQKHPKTLILQPDSNFIESYSHNSKFVSRFCKEENGQALEPWKKRSWIIGVTNDDHSMAFDYLSLLDHYILQDTVGDLPVLVLLESEKGYFHAWETQVDSLSLTFEYIKERNQLIDIQTSSVWDVSGTCISGKLEGRKLKDVQSYEEYWHSWQSFHPNTEIKE